MMVLAIISSPLPETARYNSVHVLPELYRAVSARGEDMTARMIIAKMGAFMFAQILSVRLLLQIHIIY